MGENFRFGHKAQGDADAAARARTRFETRVVAAGRGRRRDRLLDATSAASSSAGEVDAGQPLPRRAVPAARRPSPTATSAGASSASRPPTSCPTSALVYPGHGVYACRAAVEDDGEWRWWPAAINVGVRPTFVTGRGVLVEAFLLDFDGDLYGRELRLAFLARLRGERRFDSVEALVEQMHRDVEATRRGLHRRAAGCYACPRRT